jgi:hypothetical protein
MKRREWLQQHPPPKTAAALRELLAAMIQLRDSRRVHETNKQTYAQHVAYWNQQATNARAVGDTVSLNHANSQLADVQGKIKDIDAALAETAQVPARISELEADLARAAKCPQHGKDLLRHKNRPDDLFLCDIGPHFYLWTKVGTSPEFTPVDLKKPLPDIDGEMEWI